MANSMGLWSNIGAEVMTIKSDIDPEKIEGAALTVTGVRDDGVLIMNKVMTEGAGFEAIGLHPADEDGYFAAALGGMVWIHTDGSITAPGYQFIGYEGTQRFKSVESGGRPVVVLFAIPSAYAALIKF